MKSPPRCLQKLVIKLASLSRVPRWIGSLCQPPEIILPDEVGQAGRCRDPGRPARSALSLSPYRRRKSGSWAGGTTAQNQPRPWIPILEALPDRWMHVYVWVDF